MRGSRVREESYSHLPQNRLSGERRHMPGTCAPAWCHSVCKSENRRDCHGGSWHNAYAPLFLAMVLSHRMIAYYTMVAPLAKLLSNLSPRERGQNRQGFLT